MKQATTNNRSSSHETTESHGEQTVHELHTYNNTTDKRLSSHETTDWQDGEGTILELKTEWITKDNEQQRDSQS